MSESRPARQSLAEFVICNRGIVFNLALLAYILIVQHPLLYAVIRAYERGRTNYFLGALMIFLIIAEKIGIHLKLPVLNYRLRGNKTRHWWAIFIIWVFHIIINTMLLINAYTFFGWDLGAENAHWALLIGPFAVVIAELYILIYFFLKPRVKKVDNPCKLMIREFTGDAIIFVWSAVTFTTTWVYLTSQPFIGSGSFWFVLIQLLGVALIFLMMFLPLRLLYLYEEWSQPVTRKRRLWLWLTFAANVAGAMVVVYLNANLW